MLTISQLAAYADVTVKTVRHYHARGLLAEPERDHSGYRRYDAAAVVDLIRIRTLANAGVPLARVQELLHADDDEFAAAIAEVDARLRADIREREQLRDRIARLAAGDSLALPADAVAYLERLRSLGLPAQMIDAERDAWILVAAQLPEQMPLYMRLKQDQLDSAEVVELYRALAEVLDAADDDPRLDRIAERIVALNESSEHGAPPVPDLMSDELVRLLDDAFVQAVPGARRLMRLIERRGWTGWTRAERLPSPAREPLRRGVR